MLSNDQAREKFKIKESFQNAIRIDALGYNLMSLLNDTRDIIIERVNEGANIRILIIKSDSKASELISLNSSTNIFSHTVDATQSHIKYINDALAISNNNKTKGSFDIKYINWVPSCTLIFAYYKHEKDLLKVSINTPYYKTPKPRGRLNLILTKENDYDWFEFYKEQFENLWNSTPIS